MSRFDPDCRRCPRLAEFLDAVRDEHPDYYCRPVPPFGDPDGRLLVVGLAPGMHGANASGRPFTGDYAGVLLYETMHAYGFASRPVSVSAGDGLRLIDCRITNAVKCLPPQNKPVGSEISACNDFLQGEIDTLPEDGVILALGKIAHDAVLRACGMKLSSRRFAHGAWHELDGGLRMLDTYHCSRYNTNTRRLTPVMFRDIFAALRTSLAG